MANTKRVQLRRGTTAEHASFIGAEGELTIDTTRDIAIVHDGVKLGGHELVGVAATNQSIVNKVSVGIGTSNATSALTVFGDSLITGVSTFSGNVTLGGELRAPASFVIDPAAVGDNTGSVRIKGDLYVDGTQTVINSTTLEISDFIVGIASTATSDTLADGAGIKIGPDNTILYDHTNTAFRSSENFNLLTGKSYKINGTDVLTSTTLGSGVVNSSLTSVGTLTGLSVSGNLTANGTNAQIDFSPTGTGSVTINPNTAGNINKMNIGATTPGTGRFSTLDVVDTTTSARDLIFASNSSVALTADRTLTFDVTNANRSIKLAGNLDLANNFTTSGNFGLTLTTTNTTNATLPTGTITLVATTGSQTLSSKSLTSSTCDFPVSSSSISNKSYVDAMTIAFGC